MSNVTLGRPSGPLNVGKTVRGGGHGEPSTRRSDGIAMPSRKLNLLDQDNPDVNALLLLPRRSPIESHPLPSAHFLGPRAWERLSKHNMEKAWTGAGDATSGYSDNNIGLNQEPNEERRDISLAGVRPTRYEPETEDSARELGPGYERGNLPDGARGMPHLVHSSLPRHTHLYEEIGDHKYEKIREPVPATSTPKSRLAAPFLSPPTGTPSRI